MIRLGVLLAVTILAALSCGQAAAGDFETLKVASDCPAKGENRACVPVTMYLADDYRGRVGSKPLPDLPEGGDRTRVVVFAEGLLNGQPKQTYRLAFEKHSFVYSEANVSHYLPGTKIIAEVFAAYAGRTADNRPLILTDRGVLEVRTRALDLHGLPSMVTFREKDLEVLDRFYETASGPFVVTANGVVTAWDRERKLCIIAPRLAPGPLSLHTAACKAAGGPGASNSFTGKLVEATDIAHETVRAAVFPPDIEPDNMSIYRVPGTGMLVAHFMWQDEGGCGE
jgi:hypothetical protein